MSQENVDFVRGILSGASDMDKDELLAALPQLVENGATPRSNGSRTRAAPTRAPTAGTTA
jgi:hypothetical protein